MESLEMRLFLNRESIEKLEELKKSCDYFKILNWYGLSNGFYRVDVYVTPTKGSLYENAAKLLTELKEFENKDKLPLDG